MTFPFANGGLDWEEDPRVKEVSQLGKLNGGKMGGPLFIVGFSKGIWAL